MSVKTCKDHEEQIVLVLSDAIETVERPNLSRRCGLVPPLPLRLPFAALRAVQPQR